MDLLYDVCEIVAAICDNAFELWFLLSFFGLKNENKRHIFCYIGFVAVKTVISVLFWVLDYNEYLISTAIFIGISVIYCRIFLNGSRLKHI